MRSNSLRDAEEIIRFAEHYGREGKLPQKYENVSMGCLVPEPPPCSICEEDKKAAKQDEWLKLEEQKRYLLDLIERSGGFCDLRTLTARQYLDELLKVQNLLQKAIAPFPPKFYIRKGGVEGFMEEEDRRCLEDLKKAADICKGDTLEIKNPDVVPVTREISYDPSDESRNGWTEEDYANGAKSIEAAEDERILAKIVADKKSELEAAGLLKEPDPVEEREFVDVVTRAIVEGQPAWTDERTRSMLGTTGISVVQGHRDHRTIEYYGATSGDGWWVLDQRRGDRPSEWVVGFYKSREAAKERADLEWRKPKSQEIPSTMPCSACAAEAFCPMYESRDGAPCSHFDPGPGGE